MEPCEVELLWGEWCISTNRHVAVDVGSCAASQAACAEPAPVPAGSLQSLDSANTSSRPPPSAWR